MARLIYALIVGAALGAAAAWWAQGQRSDVELAQLKSAHSELLAGIATKTKAVADAVRAYEHATGLALSAADTKHTGELNAQKAETQRLRDCVRAGTCGVRIVTRYVDQPSGAGGANAAASSLGDDSIALDVAVSERVLDLRDSIAEDEAKLGYLREYAEQCARSGG
jgi:hypothetical protein